MAFSGFSALKKRNLYCCEDIRYNTATVLIESLPVADELFQGWFAVPCMGGDR